MSTTSSFDQTAEISDENIEILLQQDEGLVEFFNSFLALPCFAERLFYNKDLGVFEEFIEKIADDVGKGDAKAASQLRQFTHFKGTMYNVAGNQSRIGYYVTILDKVQGLEFIKKRRLPLFLRSELYAEYKLSKHLSSVQYSFSRGLFSDGSDDEDSGVEEPIIGRGIDRGRRRSVVSFNLSPAGGTVSTDGDESENDQDFYLPPHIRSIEETFDAWHESFKRPDSRTSMFSSGGGSTPLPRTPQIREQDEFPDTRSSSSCFSAQESDITVSNDGRPVSRISFVSDSSDKGLTPGLGSRVSSASNVSVALEIDSGDESPHDTANSNAEGSHGGSVTNTGEMVRSLSSALSFITENGEVEKVSQPLERVADELAADEELLARTETELDKPSRGRPVGETEQEKERQSGGGIRVEDPISLVPADGTQETLHNERCSVKIPQITETIFADDNDALERESTLTDISVQSNSTISQADEVFPVSSHRITDNNDTARGLEELSERLSEVSEELSDAEEGLSLPEHVEEGLGPSEDITQEDDKESNDIQTLNEEDQESLSSGKKDGSDCLHCQSVQQREEESLSESSKDTSGNTKSMDELLETKDSSIDQESIESSQLDLNSDIFKDLKSTSPRNVEEYDTMKSTKESDVSEAAEEVRNQVEANKGDEENPQTTVEKETASEEQGSLGGKLEEEEEGEEDGEGGYTTEASATTLQGIRGIFSGRRRESTVATSVAFDVDDESAFSDDGSEMEEKPYDLSTKDGFDAFKEFLLGTSGERLLQFWLEVECGRYLERDQEKTRLIQSLRDRFWRSGGIYEFSTGTKTSLNMEDASKLTYDRLYVIQPDILEPLLSYWCIRFTMHQQRRSHSNADLEYTRLVKERPKSCVKRENALSNLPQVPVHAGLAHVLPDKRLTRPQSSSVSKQSSLHQTSRSQIRAKSAHPRLIQTPKYMHTNASSKQLQYIMAPVKTGYGFEQPPGPSFPVEPEPDYLSSVRLFINPVPSPDSKIQRMLRTLHRTAITPGSPKSGCSDETESNTDVMLDSLIQGLIYERQTGNYFESFLQNSGNEVWVNCLAFWKSLQEYNAYFYADSLNPSLLSRKARTMYANFVASGSSYDVLVSGTIQMQVHKELEPPYEELFDAVEEHVLYSLLEPWNMLVKQEKDDFGCEVSKAQVLRHIEIKVLARRRQSIVQTHGGLGSADEEQEKERISVEEANRPLPVPKDGFTFETLIRNREEVEYFKEFLGKKHNKGIKDLMAWTDMETFRRVPRFMDEKRDKKAREIRDSWLGKKYFFGPDGPATREGRNLIMNLNGGRPIKERPSSPVVYESQKFVRARIERRWLMLFKQTAEFLERQKPRVAGVPELVEDIMLKRRLQRSEAAWKILNSRWVSSSRDVVALRQTLLNPENCAEFCAFVAVKGDTLEGNVQFWLEVQKYKDLCHAHAQPALIHRKIQTIIECFLNSAIAPELQIDIPIEMADKLMERLTGRNPAVHPYVFREAQMTVFRVLFNHWKEFLTYRSKIPEGEDAREHFQEQLRKHRADVKSKKEASERRRLARMSAERKKKEKEEREKRRIEDLASLFSMETASIFYSEEDDLRSWFYSKHLVELERLEHIKRLREQGIILPEEDLVEEKEETKSRRSRVSMAKSSTLSKVGDSKKVYDGASDKKSSEGSSRRLQAKLQSKSKATGQLSPSLARRGSVVSTVQSGTRRNSVVSLTLSRKDTSKDEKNTNKQGDEKEVSPKETVVDNKSERKTSEIQVIHMVPSEIETPNEINPRQNKLLPQRTRSSKRLLSAKQPPKSAGKKRVPLDAISCISDYSVISNIEFAPRGTSARKHGRQGGATLLTSKSLKDFTNSPEGAQLSMPLPLVRITSASHMDKSDTDGSLGEPSALYFKPRPLTQSMRKTPIGPGRPKGLGPTREDIQVKPDVIVN